MVKAVLTLNQCQFIKSSQFLKLNTTSILPTSNAINSNIIDENRSTVQNSSSKCSKSLLNEIFSQMNYNDLKKQKIKQAKKQIWSSFVDNCIQTTADPQTHVTNLCKKHKIIF